MNRHNSFPVVLIFIVLISLQSWSAVTTGLQQKVTTLVGDNSQTRLVWVMQSGKQIVGYDTRENRMHVIVDDARTKWRPLLSTGGHRVVYMDDSGTAVVNWNGTGKRRMNPHYVSCSWLHPTTQKQYAFCQTTTGAKDTGFCIRYNLDDPRDSLVLYRGRFGQGGISWWQVSLDGKLAMDYLPWGASNGGGGYIIPNGGIGPVTQVRNYTTGCRSTVEASNDYTIHEGENQQEVRSNRAGYRRSLSMNLQGPLLDRTDGWRIFHGEHTFAL